MLKKLIMGALLLLPLLLVSGCGNQCGYGSYYNNGVCMSGMGYGGGYGGSYPYSTYGGYGGGYGMPGYGGGYGYGYSGGGYPPGMVGYH